MEDARPAWLDGRLMRKNWLGMAAGIGFVNAQSPAWSDLFVARQIHCETASARFVEVRKQFVWFAQPRVHLDIVLKFLMPASIPASPNPA